MGGNVVFWVAESVAVPVGWGVTVALGVGVGVGVDVGDGDGDGLELAFEIRAGPVTKAVAATTTNAIAGTAKRTHLRADQPLPGLRIIGTCAWGRSGRLTGDSFSTEMPSASRERRTRGRGDISTRAPRHSSGCAE